MTKTIKIPIYFGKLIIHQVEDLKSIEQKYDLTSLHGKGACAFKNHDKNDGYFRYVMAFTDDCSPRMIAHEALHVVSFIYNDRGIYLDNENDETQCYLLGWIVNECHKILKINTI